MAEHLECLRAEVFEVQLQHDVVTVMEEQSSILNYANIADRIIDKITDFVNSFLN